MGDQFVASLDAVCRAIEKVRQLESNKEQRYLLKTALDSLRILATGDTAAVTTPRKTPQKGHAQSSSATSPREPADAPSSSGTRDATQDPDTPQVRSALAEESALPSTTATGETIDATDRAVNYATTVVRTYLLFCQQTNKTNFRILEASMELAQIMLGSGLLPVDVEWPVPQLTVPPHITASVFSKVLGMMRPSTAASSTSTAIAAPPPQAEAVKFACPFEALALVVLPIAQSIPLTEVAAFPAACAVLAAVIPDGGVRIVRGSPNVRTRSQRLLGLSGAALYAHVWWLLSISTRTQLHPALGSFAKSGLVSVAAALWKSMERAPRTLSSTGSSGALTELVCTTAGSLESTANVTLGRTFHHGSSASAAHRDVVAVLRMLIELLGVVAKPLSADSATASPTQPAATSVDSTLSSSSAAVQTLISSTPPALQPVRSSDTKVQCLTLLLQFLVNGGPSFRRSPAVVSLIKSILFPAVLQTALSNELDVFRLSLNVWLALYNTFQAELVVECGAFFQHVLFQVLTSHNTSVVQKCLVLEVITQIAEEPKNLLSLFLNYDCDAKSTNIYETLVRHLDEFANAGRVATGRDGAKQKRARAGTHVAPGGGGPKEPAAGGAATPVHPSIEKLALSTLLRIAEANVQWLDRFEVHGAAASGGHKTSLPSAEPFAIPRMTTTGPDHNEGYLLASTVVDAGCTLSAETSIADVTNVVAAKRKKSQLEEFLRLFNMEQQAEKAIVYLESSELLPALDTTSILSSSFRPRSPPTPNNTNIKQVLKISDSSSDDESNETAVGAGVVKERRDAVIEEERLLVQARRIARFLYSLDGSVDRLVLGEFFAKSFRKELHQLIFRCWIECHNFRSQTLDEALRLFLGGFKLLGEAQVVDRTMEQFAAHYCRHNPGTFSSANTAFVLSFSCCMLNTDAHSAHVAEKMTKEGFMRNNRGIDDGKDLDADVLSGIYDRIRQDEIKLRPLKPGVVTANSLLSQNAAHARTSSTAIAVLESIPLLRHLVPIAETIGDTVMIPVDAAGNILFNTVQRKRSEKYQSEFHQVLKDALALLREQPSLQPDEALNATQFVEATSVEHAIPMWDLTVDIIVDALEAYLVRLCKATGDTTPAAGSSAAAGRQDHSEKPPQAAGPADSATGHDANSSCFDDALARADHEAVFEGVLKTLRVCASFGSTAQAERLIQRLYALSLFPTAIALRRSHASQLGADVVVKQRIPWSSLRCAITILEAFAAVGSAFTANMWVIAYDVVSVLDALFTVATNHSRSTRQRHSQRGDASAEPGVAAKRWWQFFSTSQQQDSVTPTTDQASHTPPGRNDPAAALPPQQMALCLETTEDIQKICNLELWVERLYDATSYSSQSLLQMVNGLCSVCVRELEVGRVFSLLRLAEFCTVCTAVASRMQWRDLWANAEPVFAAAGCKDPAIALCAVDGLKGIAYHYLLKEELSLYRFQKDLLRPFERILMRNPAIEVRSAVQKAVYDMIENRAPQLASGWSVLLSLLSHGALLPELVSTSWSCCELLLTRHLGYLCDSFGDLVFCLTSFASNSIDDTIALLGASYLVACGSWLQAGLIPLPEAASALRAIPAELRIVEAAADLLDVPQFVDLERVSSAEVLEKLCENGGRYLGLDFTSMSLTASEWLKCGRVCSETGTCNDPSVAEKPGDDSGSVTAAQRIKRTLRLLVRAKTDVAEAEAAARSSTDNSASSLSQPGASAGTPLLAVDRMDAGGDDLFDDDTAQPTDEDMPYSFGERPAHRIHSALLRSAQSDNAPHTTNLVVAPRVVLASTPLSAQRRLVKPAGYGLKTDYHLWASLFEGLVPIVIAHSSLPVRVHAIGCIWTLIRRFGRYFAHDVQTSLLTPLLRSAITAVCTDEGLLAERSSYALLVGASLRGMFFACALDVNLLASALQALDTAARLCKLPQCVAGGLPDILIDIFRDIVLRSETIDVGPRPSRPAASDRGALRSTVVSQTTPVLKQATGEFDMPPNTFTSIIELQANVAGVVAAFPASFVLAGVEAHCADTTILQHLLPAVMAAWDQVLGEPLASALPVIAAYREVACFLAETTAKYLDVLASQQATMVLELDCGAPQPHLDLMQRANVWASALGSFLRSALHSIAELTCPALDAPVTGPLSAVETASVVWMARSVRGCMELGIAAKCLHVLFHAADVESSVLLAQAPALAPLCSDLLRFAVVGAERACWVRWAEDDTDIASSSILALHHLIVDGDTHNNSRVLHSFLYHMCAECIGLLLSPAEDEALAASPSQRESGTPHSQYTAEWESCSASRRVGRAATLISTDEAVRLIGILPSRSEATHRGTLASSIELLILGSGIEGGSPPLLCCAMHRVQSLLRQQQTDAQRRSKSVDGN